MNRQAVHWALSKRRAREGYAPISCQHFRPCCGCIALAGVVALAFAYENLRRQMAGLSSDMARLPSISASHEHFEARFAVIRSQLSRVEKPIIVIGDSLVESALLPPSLCGRPIINAGVGGATIGFFARYASIIADDANPSLVVLAVGINDAGKGADEKAFRSAYAARYSPSIFRWPLPR